MRIRSALKASLAVLTVPILIIGTLIIVEGIQHYFDPALPNENAPIANLLLGGGIVCLPMSVYFSYRTIRSFKRQQSRYGQPELPVKFFLLLIATGGLILLTFLNLALFAVFAGS